MNNPALVMLALLALSLEVAGAVSDADYARVLIASVDPASGLVDYRALAKDAEAMKTLDAYAASPIASAASDDEKLAGKINRYNARVLQQVALHIDSLAAAANGVLSDPQFFDRPQALEGGKRGLNDYEGTIRALGFPAAHFGVNCGSKGCPRLLAQPFEAATVRARLAELERASIRSTSRLVQVDGSPVLEVIELFSWYGKDFTGFDPGQEPGKHQKALRSYILARLSGEDRARYSAATEIRARSDWDWHVNAK